MLRRDCSILIGEILTWVGVGIAAFATYALYRSAVAVAPEESKETRKPRAR
jgi:hypothetical protein